MNALRIGIRIAITAPSQAVAVPANSLRNTDETPVLNTDDTPVRNTTAP